MFVDLWLNFCCASQPKKEAQDQPISTMEDSNKSILDTGQAYLKSPVDQKALQSTSQELRQKLQEAQEKRQQSQQTQQQNNFQSMINNEAEKTSIETEVEPFEGFNLLSDRISNFLARFEAEKEQRINKALAQIALREQQNSSNNGPYQGSQPTPDQQIMSGQDQQQNNIGQTTQLEVMEKEDKNLFKQQINECKSQEVQDFQSVLIQCREEMAQARLRRKKPIRKWTKLEDAELQKEYKIFKGDWDYIRISRRGKKSCQERWEILNPQKECPIPKPKNNEVKWELKDDKKIIRLVEKFGKKWSQMAKYFRGKSGKQIRERYRTKLDPFIGQKPWTREEDDLILKNYMKTYANWSLISKQLEGRPDDIVSHRFNSYLERVLYRSKNRNSFVFDYDGVSDNENKLSPDRESLNKILSSDQSPLSTPLSPLLEKALKFSREDEEELQAIYEEEQRALYEEKQRAFQDRLEKLKAIHEEEQRALYEEKQRAFQDRFKI